MVSSTSLASYKVITLRAVKQLVTPALYPDLKESSPQQPPTPPPPPPLSSLVVLQAAKGGIIDLSIQEKQTKDLLKQRDVIAMKRIYHCTD